MRITLLQYSGQHNKIFKGDNFIDDSNKTVDGDLVNSLDYHNPILRVKINDFIPTYYNYCVIGELKYEIFGDNEFKVPSGNCYYIDNYTYLNEEICDLSLSLDVLYTYCKFINYNFDVILSRHESLFDMKLEDNMLPISSVVDVSIKDGFLGDFYNIYGTKSSDITATITTSSKFSNPTTFFDGYNTSSCRTYLCNLEVINKITQALNSANLKNLVTSFFDTNPSESVVSMVVLPIHKNLIRANSNFIYSNKDAILPVGNGFITFDSYDDDINPDVNDGVHSLKINTGVFSGGTVFPFGENNTKSVLKFYDLEPYSNYELYVPYYGYVSLVYNNLSEDTNMINLRYDVNLSNGDSVVYVEEYSLPNVRNERTIIKTYCILNTNIGFKIPWGSTNALEITRNIIMTTAKVVVGIATKNAKMALMKENMEYGVDEMTKSEYNYEDYKISSRQGIANTIINGLSGVHTTTSGNICSNLSKFANFMPPYIKCYKPTILTYENYNKTIGRPSSYNGGIFNLPFNEYGVCSSIYVNKGYPTYPVPKLNDLNSIISILKTGFYK